MTPHTDLAIYSDPVDLPNDADLVSPAAATINNAPAALLNRTAFLADGGMLCALNWGNGGATTHNLKRLAYYDGDGAWFGVGDGGTDFLESSVSFGRTWTDLIGSLGSAKTLVDVAVNQADGSVTLITSSRDVYKGTRTAFATYTFALTSNALTAAAAGGSVDYEPTAALLIACYRVGATGMRVDTSANGTTWLNRTLPAAWTAYTGSSNPEVGVTAGRAVACFISTSASATIETMYSTDGGVTWTGVTLTSGIAPANFTGCRITRPVYDPASLAWFFCVSSTTADVAEVWKSVNGGAAWTVVKTFTSKDVEVQSASLVGPVWGMLTKKGRVLASLDAGASWRWLATQDGTASNFAMRGGGGGGLIVNSSSKTSMRSHRAGRSPGVAV